MRELTETELDQVNGGKLIENTEQINGGGHIPKGQANGVPETVVSVENPGGNFPPGHQP